MIEEDFFKTWNKEFWRPLVEPESAYGIEYWIRKKLVGVEEEVKPDVIVKKKEAP